MTRGFVFFLIVSLLAGVAMWGYIGADGQASVLEFLRLKRPPAADQVRIADVSLTGVTVRAEVAETAADRERGLAGRPMLSELAGMLFLFDTSGAHAFWMKGMIMPIDIIWIDDGKIVDIAADVQPSSDGSLPLYTPSRPANRVLEVSAGFAKRHGLIVGTPVTIRFDPVRESRNRAP